jgi:hypothetical protein
MAPRGWCPIDNEVPLCRVKEKLLEYIVAATNAKAHVVFMGDGEPVPWKYNYLNQLAIMEVLGDSGRWSSLVKEVVQVRACVRGAGCASGAAMARRCIPAPPPALPSPARVQLRPTHPPACPGGPSPQTRVFQLLLQRGLVSTSKVLGEADPQLVGSAVELGEEDPQRKIIFVTRDTDNPILRAAGDDGAPSARTCPLRAHALCAHIPSAVKKAAPLLSPRPQVSKTNGAPIDGSIIAYDIQKMLNGLIEPGKQPSKVQLAVVRRRQRRLLCLLVQLPACAHPGATSSISSWHHLACARSAPAWWATTSATTTHWAGQGDQGGQGLHHPGRGGCPGGRADGAGGCGAGACSDTYHCTAHASLIQPPGPTRPWPWPHHT